MARLIDADDLIEGRVSNDPVVIAAKCAPTVDAEPVVHARAVKQSPFGKGSRYCIWKVSCKCSNCGEYVSDVWNYCPDCMAKLDGGEGE